MATAVFDDLQETKSWLKEQLGIGTSFDVLARDFRIAGVDCYVVCIDGMFKDDVLERVMSFALATKEQQVRPDELGPFFRERLPYQEVSPLTHLEDAVTAILSGTPVLFADGAGRALAIDARKYPGRTPEEPALEKVLHGPKDGLTETLVDNTALIRRRVRDPHLRFEIIPVGRRSRTDVCLAYINDIAHPDLVRHIRRKLKQIVTDALPMAEKSLAEHLSGPYGWTNPFPKIRYTERPDICAVHLLEGRVVILLDTTPVALILPATFFDQLEHAEEYHEQVPVGIFTRFVRYSGLFLAWGFAPLYVWLVVHPRLIPGWLSFIGPNKTAAVPLFLQFIIADLGIQLIRLALIHVPESLSTSLGVIGAVLIGDLATKVNLLQPEAILYITIAALGEFSIPALELANGLRMFRFILFFLAALPVWWALWVGFALNFVLLASAQSFGEAYLWPLVPLDVGALWGVLVRGPMPSKPRRPSFVSPQDPDRF